MSDQDDIRRSLLSNKKAPFDKMHQDCLVRIQRIKQKNDFLQKHAGTDIQDVIKDQIKKQKQFLTAEIKEIKNMINSMQSRFKDPESKNKLKTVKNQTQKQVQRNKVILKDLISRSFLSNRSNDDQDNGNYIVTGRSDYQQPNGHTAANNRGIGQHQQESMLTDQVHIDYEIERKINQEKSSLINEVEESTNKINEIMNDMAIQVDHHGENLNIIEDELIKANKNVEMAGEEMDQAAKLQKKSRKKYIIFAIVLILAAGLVMGIVFIVK